MKPKFISLIFALSIIVSACTPKSPTSVTVLTRPTPANVEATVQYSVAATLTAQPTFTPVPTTTPTTTPTSSPTPIPFNKWHSTQAVTAFKQAGLETESTRPMTKDDYGMAPMMATEGTKFLIPSLCNTCGGRIFSFANPDELATTKAFYVELGRQNAMFFSWTFEKDNILVQINGDLPKATAQQYNTALQTIGNTP